MHDPAQRPADPAVSIGVPVFNGERHLESALQSLVEQTYDDLEIIISDNASTDGTQAIAARFAAADPRVRYVRQPRNLGAAANFAHSLSLARGRYFRWAAADDVCGATYVERCTEVLEADPGVVLAYPKTQFIDAAGEVLEQYEDRMHLAQDRPSDRFRALLEKLRRCNVIYGLTRTSVLRACRPLGAYSGSDVIVLGDLALRGRFHEVPEILFSRRFHEDAASAMSAAARSRHFRPDVEPGPALYRWRLMCEHLRSLSGAPIPLSERVRVAAFVLRRGVSERDRLARELRHAGRYYFSRRARSRMPTA